MAETQDIHNTKGNKNIPLTKESYINEVGKVVLPVKFASRIIPFNLIQKKKKKLRRRKKHFRDIDRKEYDKYFNLNYPSIYSIRPTYRDTHSPSASKNKYCDCCEPIKLPSLREELYEWSHKFNERLVEMAKKKPI